jgi:hypothetical protein
MTKLNFRSAILIATAVLATFTTAMVHVASWTGDQSEVCVDCFKMSTPPQDDQALPLMS